MNYFKEYPYKIELHCHTMPCSSCAEVDSKTLVKEYKRLGFDAICITNHFIPSFYEMSNEEMWEKYYSDIEEITNLAKKEAIEIILGAEIRFSENNNDYLVYGIDKEFIIKAKSALNGGIDRFYKNFKNDKNVILQAHPFRKGMVLANPESLDGIEVFNMHPNHNSNNSYALRYASEYGNFIVTCGSDMHHEGHWGVGAIRTKTLPKDSFELAEILKSKDYVFDMSGLIAIPYPKT